MIRAELKAALAVASASWDMAAAMTRRVKEKSASAEELSDALIILAADRELVVTLARATFAAPE